MFTHRARPGGHPARSALHPDPDEYDLRRRRLNGMIHRLERSNTYTLTPDGLRVAVFHVKVHDRLLRR